MSLDWNRLRVINRDQRDSFEALCCVLASHEQPPNGKEFIRNRPPESGCECYWENEDGSQIGWQAKFFTTETGKVQWQELDKSVKSAIVGYPKLVKYFICLPRDLTRGDKINPKKKYERDFWDSHKATWEKWAAEHRRSIKFEFWGEAQILERLSIYPGWFAFWFEKDLFTLDWFSKHLNQTIKNVGRRYMPKHDVKINELESVFTGLSRSIDLIKLFQKEKKSVTSAFAYFQKSLKYSNYIPTSDLSNIHEGVTEIIAILVNTERLLLRREKVDWFLLDTAIESSATQLRNVSEKLRDLIIEQYELQRKKETSPTDKSKSDSTIYHLRDEEKGTDRLSDSLSELQSFVNSPSADLWSNPIFVLAGEGGSGKTHLFCKMASRQIELRIPAILLLGGHLRKENDLLSWVKEKLGQMNRRDDEFLEALDMCGQVANNRVILFIDAINESELPFIWKDELNGLLARLEVYPWIGLALSVRANPSYESDALVSPILPEDIGERATILWHTGFSTVPVEEISNFFATYNLEPPLVPLWHDVYQNPLFLNMLCDVAQENGLKSLPPGFQGISSIFTEYLERLNKSISQKIGFDPLDKIVLKVVSELTTLMIDPSLRSLPYQHAKAIVAKYDHTTVEFEKSLFSTMLSEGILRRDTIFHWQSNNTEDIVTFTFERFTDHMVVSKVLDRYKTKEEFISRFSEDEFFKQMHSNNIYNLLTQHLLEALAIQLPERFEHVELTDLKFSNHASGIVHGILLKSLLLRNPDRFSDRVINLINRLINSDQNWRSKTFDVLLKLAPRGDHPLNALRFHKFLFGFSLAERDAIWTTALHYMWQSSEDADPSAIHRLIHWCMSKNTERLDSKGRNLYGITVAWFLTSTNREIRDRATKALVALYENHLDDLRVLLFEPNRHGEEELNSCFLEVNDPYIVERLLGVAFGVATRSINRSGIGELVQSIYDRYYRYHCPPPNIMIRDYTLCIIKFALHIELPVSVDLENLEPPFESNWPKSVPARDEMEKQFDSGSMNKDDNYYAGREIYGSATMGDFGTYIMGIDLATARTHNYLENRLSEPLPKLKSELLTQFLRKLTKNQRMHYDIWKSLQNPRFVKQLLNPDAVVEDSPVIITTQKEFDFCKSLADIYFPKFWNSLRSKNKRADWETIQITPERFLPFDGKIAQGWVLQRVLELGWKADLHAEFDRTSRQYTNYSREPPRIERIGKKYQWIAWYELQGMLADNFWRHEFNGPELFRYDCDSIRRNIDPTMLVEEQPESTEARWWDFYRYDRWKGNDPRWFETDLDTPDPALLVEIVHPVTREHWIAMSFTRIWREDVPDPSEHYHYPHAELWYQMHAYLVRKSNRSGFIEWAKQQFIEGTWLPENDELHGIYLGEFHWSESYLKYSHSISIVEDDPSSIEFVYPNHEYMWSAEYDHSGTNSISISLPHRVMIDLLQLKRTNVEGEWVNSSGKIVANDPSVKEGGSTVLLIRKDELLEALSSSDYELIWRMKGEKIYNIPEGYRINTNRNILELGGVVCLQDAKFVSTRWLNKES